jgi:hypothetical protein
VPNLAVTGPLSELHLGHEPLLDAVGPRRERTGRRVERRGVDLDRLEQAAELAAEGVVPAWARADLPRVPERGAVGCSLGSTGARPRDVTSAIPRAQDVHASPRTLSPQVAVWSAVR